MGFKDEEFSAKLSELNNSQASIETLSQYIVHHRKHSKKIVKLWRKQTAKEDIKDRLALIFLANDVIQNGRRKTDAFAEDFKDVIPGAFHHTYNKIKESERKHLMRVLNIWNERKIFPADFIDSIRIQMLGSSGPPAKKLKLESSSKKEARSSGPEDEEDIADDDTIPDPEALIKLLTDLDTKAASGDRPVRERISKLPSEVQDTSVLETITDLAAAEKLSAVVDDACDLLSDYNLRLANEMQDRRKAGAWLKNFIAETQRQLKKDEAMLKSYKEKLEQVSSVRAQLNDHINNLPDMDNLKAAPLPSLTQLFKPLS